MEIDIKRIYDEPAATDGYRILADRLWPRGISKETAHIDYWAKDLAPSPALRRWFGHQPDKWPEFEALYWQELQNGAEALKKLKEEVKNKSHLTLLYAAKDTEHTHALVLEKYLKKALRH